MFSANLVANNSMTSFLLISFGLLVVVGSCMLMRKMTNHNHNKMLEAQSFALENPQKINKIKLVDGSEVCCIVTLNDKSAEVIAYGVEAVRVYDKLMLLNPTLG